MDIIEQALNIAKDNLRSCYTYEGILAGHHHFNDYWARDSFFGSFGCLAIKDYEIVKKNLELHLRHMNKFGQLPLRIGKSATGIVLAYLGIKQKKKVAVYHIDKSKNSPVDQNSLFLIALCEYVKKTHDFDFFIENKKRIEGIMWWNLHIDEDNDLLIEENKFCNWEDSIKKKGKVLYSNVCHCHALKCLSELFLLAGNKKESIHYLGLHNEVKKKINELFWTGEHYLDWIDKGRTYNYFSTDGNLLAVLWDIADNVKAKHIEECSHIFEINEIPSTCVHPEYPKNLIAEEIRLIGLGDYHTSLSWIWLGAINALAKHKLGMRKEAKETLEKMAALIVEFNGVYEIYEKSAEPVKRFFYKAEFPLAWSAGMFVYAVKEITRLN